MTIYLTNYALYLISDTIWAFLLSWTLILNPSVSVQTTCLHVICCSNRSQISVNGEDVTLCPCLPGSPDSPLNPLWPCRQEQQNSLIKKIVTDVKIKTHIMSERGNNIRYFTHFHAGETRMSGQAGGAGVGTLKNTTAYLRSWTSPATRGLHWKWPPKPASTSKRFLMIWNAEEKLLSNQPPSVNMTAASQFSEFWASCEQHNNNRTLTQNTQNRDQFSCSTLKGMTSKQISTVDF